MNSQLKKQVLEKIKPTQKEHEEFEQTVLKFKRKLKRASNKLKYKIDFFIGGSFGKGTYLKGTSDVDIFARFDLSYKDHLLSDMLYEILKEAKLSFKKQKGSRDYYSVLFGPRGKKIIFEVIPNRNIKDVSQMLNSTDVSPMHVEFLKTKAKQNLELTDEIRLCKQFFKAKGLYGAESYINGFSGHVIDILVAYFGSLEKLLENAKTWNEQIVLDICDYYKSYDDAIASLPFDKLSSLIVIDPILKDRNASRALSEEHFSEFVLISNMTEELKKEDFEIHKPKKAQVISDIKEFAKENNLKFLIYDFKFEIKNESEDIVGSKLLKLHKKLFKMFDSYDFNIFKDDFFIDMSKGICLSTFLFEKTSLPNIKKIYGPKVSMRDAIINFLKNRDRYFVENDRVCIYEKRIINKIEEICSVELKEMEVMLGKDMSFVNKLKIIK